MEYYLCAYACNGIHVLVPVIHSLRYIFMYVFMTRKVEVFMSLCTVVFDQEGLFSLSFFLFQWSGNNRGH